MDIIWRKICGNYGIQPNITKSMEIINKLEENNKLIEYDYCKRYSFDCNDVNIDHIKEITNGKRVYYKFIGDTIQLTVCPVLSEHS